MNKKNDYDKQADNFLKENGITFRAVLKDTKAPAWANEDGKPHPFGHHYRVTLAKGLKRLSFDFFGSAHDKEHGVKTERAYSVLACISNDCTCPETFEDFCADYGYDTDSRTAYRTFKRCAAFGKRLRAFFTEKEIAALHEIQ